MAVIPALPKTWINGDILTHSDLNNSLTTIRDAVNASALFKDVSSQTVTVTVTFSVSQTFSAGMSITGTVTMLDAASRIVPGATSFAVRNAANSADNLLVSDAGAVTVRAGLTVTTGTITGTLATAAQANVTSLGTLTALTLGGNLTLNGANRKIISGATGMTLRNTGDTASWIAWVEGGGVTIGNSTIDTYLGSVSGTTSTTGFPIISSIAGTPTGAAPNGSFVWDSSGKKFWVRDSTGWLGVVLT